MRILYYLYPYPSSDILCQSHLVLNFKAFQILFKEKFVFKYSQLDKELFLWWYSDVVQLKDHLISHSNHLFI